MVPVDDGATPAPIDRSVLERIRLRFAGRRLFESVEIIEEERESCKRGTTRIIMPTTNLLIWYPPKTKL